jgi:hypothetical protein
LRAEGEQMDAKKITGKKGHVLEGGKVYIQP